MAALAAIRMEPNPASTGGDALAAGRRVIEAEANALADLAASLDGDFEAAVALIEAGSGRVIVTGMGKSGLVGRKIAATLASTGTPSFFVHPAEASHGDLGMIARDDVILALSNSGNTAELSAVLHFAARYTIPVLGITANANSALAEHARVTIVLPPAPEACPMGLAPTTSTTLMLALGDALAVALLERRGFSSSEFRLLHPGGSLGHKLMKVSDLMHKGGEVPLVPPGMPMQEAILEMTARRFGCVGVVGAGGALAGIVTDGDLRRAMEPGLLSRPVEAVMNRAPRSIKPSAMAAEALALMNDKGITSLFVVDEGRPVGIIHIHDCLRAGVA